jgi:ribokinase/non-canonical purine NTP pyrophosphatase (RdgB/HAM1 family)
MRTVHLAASSLCLLLASIIDVCTSLAPLNTMTASRVVVVGSANQDLTSYTGKLPVLGETVMGQDFETSCGGKGANQAKAAASLGLAPVTMVSRVGNDVFGRTLLGDFDRKQVQYDPEDTILKDGTSSGVATIVVDNDSGDNMIIVTPGANYALTPDNVDQALRKLTDPPAVVVVQLEIKYEAALQALKTAKELGAITVFNPAPAPSEEGALDEFFPFVDIFIPNETELRTLCCKVGDDSVDEQQMAESLLKKGVNKAVVCTLGSRGAMIVTKQEDGSTQVNLVDAPKDLPARKLPVIDTIGAGDAFCGALSTYLASGVDMIEAGNLACGFASMSVRRRGANYPDPHELPEALRPASLMSREAATKPKMTFITGNAKKLAEVRQILPDDFPFELVAKKVDLPELQGADPHEIAREKCRMAAEKIGGPCFTEDTCLSFNALNGMPGPYIKWFLEKCGHDGLNRMLQGFEDKSATASTLLAFTMGGDDKEISIFEGKTAGKVVPARGSLEFGWDPIFEPDEGNGLTYAEMDKDSKNRISHRGRALANFCQYILDENNVVKK